MTTPSRPLSIFALLGVLAACSSQDQSTIKAADENRGGNDVTILQAWIGGGAAVRVTSESAQTTDHMVDPAKCDATKEEIVSGIVKYTQVDGDCSSELESVVGSTLVGSAKHLWTVWENGGSSRISGQCATVEFRTLIAVEVFNQPSFSGFGFDLGREYYISKDKFREAGRVTLADGRPGIVHRFFQQGVCSGTGGSTNSVFNPKYGFKPYARFVAGGKTYNVWDSVSEYYLLGRKNSGEWIRGFDRQRELLR